MISLNITSVTDEIFALTALRDAVSGGTYGLTGNRSAASSNRIPPVLTRDNLPALRIIVRSVFSSMVTRLYPYVTDSATDNGNPRAPQPYDESHPVTLDLEFGDLTSTLSAGALMVLKRYLEHLLALMVIEKVYLPINSVIAAENASQVTSLLTAISSLLTSPEFPGMLNPCYI